MEGCREKGFSPLGTLFPVVCECYQLCYLELNIEKVGYPFLELLKTPHTNFTEITSKLFVSWLKLNPEGRNSKTDKTPIFSDHIPYSEYPIYVE